LEGRRQPYILAAGRLWDEAKNIGILEKVAGEVSWPIRIAGEEAFEGNAFESGGLETLGLLTPAVMKHTMAEAEIWAHPALYEPFGLAVLEAAQAGCALVLSDIPTLRELWDEAAVFVAPQDASAWKITLEDLIRQPARRNALGIKARGRAKQYSLDRCAQAYDSLYRSLT
jgi:glycosyltransferase involved in cell wall biosynthesis